MNTQDRKNRVIAKGEHSNHSHVIVGDALVVNNNGELTLTVGSEGATLRHILESDWVQTGTQTWTKEHGDIELAPGATYKYVAQFEYDPYEDVIKSVQD
jgi:hypothetical protein